MTPERTAAGPPAAVPAAPPAPHNNGGAAPLSLPPSTSRQGEAPTTRARSSPGRARVVPSAPLAAVRESAAASGLHVTCDLPPGLRAIAGAMSEDTELLVKITSGTRREPGICAQLGLAWHHHRISRGSTSGWPDLVIGDARAGVFWELKTMKGRVTPAQAQWLARLAAWGCTVGVRRPCCLLSGRIARELAALAGLGGAR